MHLQRNEIEVAEDILKMQEVGFNASEQDSLPALHLEVYGFALKNCGDCKHEAYNALIKWATKKLTPKQTDMAYKIKPEFIHKEFVFRHQGKILVVTAANLTPERARMMLANPQYAHAIIGQEELFPDPTPEQTVITPATTETSKEPVSETSKEETGPKLSGVATASTSTEAQNAGSEQKPNAEEPESKLQESKPPRAKPGPKPKK